MDGASNVFIRSRAMSKIITPEEACRMPRDQQGYVPVWVEYLPLNNGTSQIFEGYVDAIAFLVIRFPLFQVNHRAISRKEIKYASGIVTRLNKNVTQPRGGGGKNRNGNNP